MKVTLNPRLQRSPASGVPFSASPRLPVSKSSAISCPSEHEEQKALMLWVKTQIGRGRVELTNLFAIPNGGDRHIAVAGKLKAEGVKRGVPDLFLAWPTKTHHGLFIELKKRAGGTVSTLQKAWHEGLRAVGYAVVVAKGCEEAREAITTYLEPLRKGDGL